MSFVFSQMSEAELQSQLRKLYVEDKLSIREIAEKWGVSKNTISNHLRRLGIKTRSKGKTPIYTQLRMSKEQLRQYLYQMYVEEEWTAKEIADQLEVSPNAISKQLVALGFERRSRGKRTLYERIGMSEEEFKKRLHDLAEKGLTTKDIADYLNTSYNILRGYLQKYGVTTNEEHLVKCLECNEVFQRKNKRQYYCSSTCRNRAIRAERIRKGLCVRCGKPVAEDKPKPTTVGRPASVTCRECREYSRLRQQARKHDKFTK